MQAFQRAADRTFGSENQAGQPEPLPNLMETGFLKLQEIFQSKYTHKRSSRFCWGSTLSHDIPQVGPDADNFDNLNPADSPPSGEHPEGENPIVNEQEHAQDLSMLFGIILPEFLEYSL
ncbi:uncharacterized protein MELLADRAFT_63580 [Melampsora larici-populina 98AG31]|uniref:Uncharacterized protein n=1 Tax=Melampsora larici-populina (strain 98AG31 / pathotype 3-4-7) TaxID=747676 RepID=F4RN61_MELLP|nr:uncharacterized protein MELLADRAFT_63580 [Melampsora larici-populina 98AG31]EGG06274.1 hypothetical protein MELLADRAFT_63580 [Melampsora larici-populina 98AG31]